MSIFQRQEESKATENVKDMIEVMPISTGDPVVAAAVGSVLYSWYQFYIKNDTERGLFVGLWAPTLLAAAGYLQQKDAFRKLKQGFSGF